MNKLFPDIRTIVVIVFSTLVVYVFGLLYLEPNDFRKMFSAVMLSVSLAVLIGYAKGFIDRKIESEVRLLIAGIISTWSAVVYARTYQMVFIDWNNPFIAPLHTTFWEGVATTLGYFLVTVGGLFHLAAPGALGGSVPRRNWIKLGISVGAGLLLFLIPSYLL